MNYVAKNHRRSQYTLKKGCESQLVISLASEHLPLAFCLFRIRPHDFRVADLVTSSAITRQR